jgi:hypothetical protein
MKLWSILLVSWMAFPTAFARPAEIILLRHAEKPAFDWNVHLSKEGRKRAAALADFLTTNPLLLSNGLPAALFAARPTFRGHGRRPAETLEPLARKLKLPIQTPEPAKDAASLAAWIMRDASLDGKTVVVCWVHEDLPALAAAFGVKHPPSHWKSSTFDRVWVITYDRNKARLRDLPQRLLPGDSPE